MKKNKKNRFQQHFKKSVEKDDWSSFFEPNPPKPSGLELLWNEFLYKKGLITIHERLKGRIEGLTSLALPLVRASLPNSIVNELVSVQPMCAPHGLAYSLNYSYKKKTLNDLWKDFLRKKDLNSDTFTF